MIGKKFEKLIVKEIEIFYEDYKKSTGNENEELIEKLIEHFTEEPKKQKKEILEEIRCQAITSKKTQCTAKRIENETLCKIHMTKGTKYGILGNSVAQEEKSDDDKSGCVYMYTKGKMKSQLCNKKCEDDSSFCKKHTVVKGKPEKVYKSLEIIEEDEYESENVENAEDIENSDDD